jgi:hypothetical protein
MKLGEKFQENKSGDGKGRSGGLETWRGTLRCGRFKINFYLNEMLKGFLEYIDGTEIENRSNAKADFKQSLQYINKKDTKEIDCC